MNELALFAGAGGGMLGSVLLGHRIVCAVELDPYCREVLLRRQEEGFLPPFPVWDDIRTFDGGPWRGKVDIVSAGFPCQPFSVAGKRRGEADDRNLWPETLRIIRQVRPRYAFLENVPGLLTSGYFDTVLGDLAASGYDAEWIVLGADDVGAPHIRKRLWILADAKVQRSQGFKRLDCDGEREGVASQVEWSGRFDIAFERSQDVGHASIPRLQITEPERKYEGSTSESDWWESEPNVGRVAHGVASRVDRLKALGNGQVPSVAATAFRILAGEERG